MLGQILIDLQAFKNKRECMVLGKMSKSPIHSPIFAAFKSLPLEKYFSYRIQPSMVIALKIV